MRRLLGRILIVILLLGSGCSNPSGTPSSPTPVQQPPVAAWQQRLDAFIRSEMEAKGIPAISIAVVDDQEIAWSHGYGLSDPETEAPVTAETVYRVASVSKLFTALTVMQLVEKDSLDLDAPITTYLPEFQPENPFEDSITLRQLLSHRSGLVREPPVGHYFDPTEPSLEEMVQSLNATTLIYAPGTREKYSNAAVSVAGYAVQRTTGTPFAAHAQEALIDTMGLVRTSFLPQPGLGIGYMWRYDTNTLTPAPVFELGIGPAANLYTTVSDLGRFISTLFEISRGNLPNIMMPETLREMWTVQVPEDETTSGFGLGFYVSEFEGRQRVQHAGVMYGYATRVYALPEQNIGVAIVGNLDATNPVVDRIANYALSLLSAFKEGQELPSMRRTQPVDPILARHIRGVYHGPDEITLIERNGKLFIERGAERHAVRATGDTLVTDGRLGHGFWFVPRDDTLVTGSGDYQRQPPPTAPPAPANEAWQDLIGEYGWNHNVLYVYERDHTLQVLIEWFFRYALEEVAPDSFLFPDDGLYMHEPLTFHRDETGRVTEASLAGVVFPRRSVGDGAAFRITPQQPMTTLRAAAAKASPPLEDGEFRVPDLVDVATLDPAITLDIRYATLDNFMGAIFYDLPRAFLQRPAAEALVQALDTLKTQGYGITVYDGYRPWSVTKMFYDATPDSLRLFVADPATGSRHNRGSAIDLGLYYLATGEPAPMVSHYDEFTPRAFPDYVGGTPRQRYHRELLRDAMESAGFTVYEAEWWHFDYKDWKEYPILNTPFEEVGISAR